MSLEVGTYGAKRQTWKVKTIRELLTGLLAEHPSANEQKLRQVFIDAVRNDEDYFAAVCDYAFDNAMAARVKRPVAESSERQADRAQQRANEAKLHAEKVSYIKEQIVLLNQELPNGKRARFCTLDYLFKLGGAYRRVGKRGSQKLVGETYSETQYRAKLGSVV
jgi:hypothetical protein